MSSLQSSLWQCNPGSRGHPELCARPCVYVAKSGMCRVDSCKFCHMPHAQQPVKLDQRHRNLLPKLAPGDSVELFLEIFRGKVEHLGVLEGATQVLSLLEKEASKHPPEHCLARKQAQNLRKVLGRMTLANLIRCGNRRGVLRIYGFRNLKVLLGRGFITSSLHPPSQVLLIKLAGRCARSF